MNVKKGNVMCNVSSKRKEILVRLNREPLEEMGYFGDLRMEVATNSQRKGEISRSVGERMKAFEALRSIWKRVNAIIEANYECTRVL